MNRMLAGVALLVAVLAGIIYLTGYVGGDVIADLEPRATPDPKLRDVSAVLVSGDMGFSVGMGRDISTRLTGDGIPVVAVNSLAYFRHRRSPAETEALINAAVQHALRRPGTQRVALVGQSFGADMLQTGLAGLRPALRPRVMSVALIVPGDTVEFRATPSDVFNKGEPSYPALPTARQLDWVPAICIRGAEETDSLCPLLALPNVRGVVLPGGHPMHRDDALVYKVLWASIVDAAEAARDLAPAARPAGVAARSAS